MLLPLIVVFVSKQIFDFENDEDVELCRTMYFFTHALVIGCLAYLYTLAKANPQEGIVKTRIYYEAPVEMPILSIAEISQEGNQGSSTMFRQKNGYVEDNETLMRQHFVKRKGVYFMNLFVKRRPAPEGFGRPGSPP